MVFTQDTGISVGDLKHGEYHKLIKCTVNAIMPKFVQLQSMTKGNRGQTFDAHGVILPSVVW